ncbi:MAG: hypothetical protein ACRC24_04245 [Vibrionaceae bacterium]
MTAVGNTADAIASAATTAATALHDLVVVNGATEPGHGVTSTTTTTMATTSTTTQGGATGGTGEVDSGLDGGLIAGIVVGVLLGVGVVCAGLAAYCSRGRCQRGSEDQASEVEMGGVEANRAPNDGTDNGAFETDEDGNANGRQKRRAPQAPPSNNGSGRETDSDA